jgi:nitrogen regulatory protein PII
MADEELDKKSEHQLIIAIVNSGFSDQLMDAARNAGARGGTVLDARGTAREEAEALFHIAFHPEKEIVMILANDKIKDDILHAIYKEVGLGTPGQGICFSIPVDETAGLKKVKKLTDELEETK